MGDFSLLYPSRFLQSAHLVGKPDVTKTIKKIVVEELGEDKKKKVIVSFSDATLEWVVPRTCAEALALMFGRDTDKWVGRQVTLYAQEGAGFGGDGYAIRVRGSPSLERDMSATIQRGRKTIKVKVIPTGKPETSAKANGKAEPEARAELDSKVFA